MWKKWGAISAALVMVWASGCGQDTTDDDRASEVAEDTGIALGVDFKGGTDVAGFEFTFRLCGSESPVLQNTRSLEDLVLPGMIPGFENQPFDAKSHHLFSDYFTALDAGCYDVAVQPITAEGRTSNDCRATGAHEVFVVDKMTTEVLLVSQCDGPERGAGDVVASLNHPPQIETVEYAPSKFVFECERTHICITVVEPDGDPVEIEFEQTGGDKLRFGPDVISTEVDGDRTTKCIEVVPVFADDYEFKITAYDQIWRGGKLVRAEDVLGEPSRAELTIPMYTNWDFELECYDQNADEFHRFLGVREIDRVEGCFPIWPEQFYCSEMYWDDTETSCPDGEFKPETIYPLCEDHEGQYQVD